MKDKIDLSIGQLQKIIAEQGWTEEEAIRWINDEEPLPEVKYPDTNTWTNEELDEAEKIAQVIIDYFNRGQVQ